MKGPLRTPKNDLLRHLSLIAVLLVIYLTAVLTFLVTYALSKPLGPLFAAFVSAVASLTFLMAGARVFWHVAEKSSEKFSA